MKKNDAAVYTEIAEYPLAGDMAKLDSLEIPDPPEDSQHDDFRLGKEMYGHEKRMIGSSEINVFEPPWRLRVLDKFLMGTALEPANHI